MRTTPLFLAFLLLTYSVIEIWFVNSSDPQKPESGWCRYWLCSTALETQGEYQAYLGGGGQPTPTTVSGFADILQRDPGSSYRWCDLAEASLEAGQEKTARYCIATALDLAPHSANILLRASNFYWRIGDVPEALRLSHRMLSEIKEYDAIIFSSFDRFETPVDTILRTGIPVSSRATQSYLRHLLSTSRVNDARRVWGWVSDHGFADDAIAAEYTNYLLGAHAYDEAGRSWAEYLGKRRRDYAESNSIFNGDFESEPVPGARLDWQIGQVEGAQTGRDSSAAHSGKFALHIQFAGAANIAFSHVTQTAVVRPGAHSFEYFIKTEGITTNQGVRFRIFDPESPSRLDILTEPLTGTNDWRKVQTTFAVSPQTRVAQVQVARLASEKFDNKIAGSVWIDAVRLTP